MATDQGKTSNVNALVLMGEQTNRTPATVGTTKFRPPFKPVTLSALAGGRSGERFRPLKRCRRSMARSARRAVRGIRRLAAARGLSVRKDESLDRAPRARSVHVRTRVGCSTHRRSARSRSMAPTQPRSST
jgi:sarcosine oxidase subunit alpha